MLTRAAAVLAAMWGAGLLGIVSAEARPDMVRYQGDYAPGTIVVRTNERRLYLIIDSNRALRYPVGVGKAGKQWTGTARIEGKYRDPAWAPPEDVKRDNPKIADVIAGGSPANPMGVAAMTLSGGGQYAIHGTNRPGTIGRFVSYGCIRMYNADIDDLYRRVSVGTPVVVTQQ
jgi:lipoprotein-anchoring transpeptidase ErfK/SrfK